MYEKLSRALKALSIIGCFIVGLWRRILLVSGKADASKMKQPFDVEEGASGPIVREPTCLFQSRDFLGAPETSKESVKESRLRVPHENP